MAMKTFKTKNSNALSSDASIFSYMAAVELVRCMKTASRSAGRGRSELSTNGALTKELILDSGRRLCLGLIRVRANLGTGEFLFPGVHHPCQLLSTYPRLGIVGAGVSGTVMRRLCSVSHPFLEQSM